MRIQTILATACILQLYALAGNEAKAQTPSVTIVSPAANSTVNLNGSMHVVVKARFANCNTSSAYVIDTTTMTELGNTSSWNYVPDANDPMGGYYQASVPIATNNYTNVRIKVTGTVTTWDPGPPPKYVYSQVTDTKDGITITAN